MSMNISASLNPTAPPSAPASLLMPTAQAPGQARSRDEARQAAQDFVALSLIEPIFKELRESNNAAPPFAPNAAEKQFQALLDRELAIKLSRTSNLPLVDKLTDQLAGELPLPIGGPS